MSLRVAFPVFGGKAWTGGLNYLVNLFSALAESAPGAITPVVFAGTDQDEQELASLLPYLGQPPLRSPLWNKGSWPYRVRLIRGLLLQRDIAAEQVFRQIGVDLVFQHADLYGARFGIPTLAWIADFQHRHLPQMFSRANALRRELAYHVMARSSTQILVSSQDARQDCAHFYPASAKRIAVLPFTCAPAQLLDNAALQAIRGKYQLPEKFFYLPNQFWKHKDHLTVVEALHLARERGQALTIAATGGLQDPRHPDYPASVIRRVEELGLQDSFRYLGLIPRQDIYPLMQAAAALVNPSLFEGWSTTVEEAKALGVPLVLSGLRVHREQAPEGAWFFQPGEPAGLADALIQAWVSLPPGPRPQAEALATEGTRERRAEFARNFVSIAQATVTLHREQEYALQGAGR